MVVFMPRFMVHGGLGALERGLTQACAELPGGEGHVVLFLGSCVVCDRPLRGSTCGTSLG